VARQGCRVTEVRGPSRKVRHDRGKSDRVDAEAAARSVLAGTSTGVPKSGDDWVDTVRVLRIARTSAMHSRSQACNQLHPVVVSAPASLRDELMALTKHQLIARAERFRVAELSDPSDATRWTLRLLAQRHQMLSDELERLDKELHRFIEAHAPHMLAIRGAHTGVAGTLLVVAGDNPERLQSGLRSLRCAASHRCRRPRARPTGTASTVEAIARATGRSGGS
jgi:transposase